MAGGLELEYSSPPDALVRAFLANTNTRPLAPAAAPPTAPPTGPQPQPNSSTVPAAVAHLAKEDPEHIYQSVDECLSARPPEQLDFSDHMSDAVARPPLPLPPLLPLPPPPPPLRPPGPAPAPAPEVDLIMFTPAPVTQPLAFTFAGPPSPSAAAHVYSSVVRLEPQLQLAAAVAAPIASTFAAPDAPPSPEYAQVPDADALRYFSFPFTPLPNSVPFSLPGTI